LSRAWSVFWTGVRTVASTVWNFVHRNIIAPIWALIRSVFTSAQNTLRAAWTTFWNAVRTTASTVWNFVHRSIIAPVWATIRSVFTVAQTALRAAWSVFWNAVRTTASTIFTAIRQLVDRVWGEIRGVWTRAQGAVERTWGTFWGTVKRVGSDAIGAVKTRIDQVFGQIKTGTDNFVKNVGAAFDKIKGAFSGPWDWVKRNVFDRIAAAYNKVAGVVGAPKLNLADGGPVGNNATQLSNRGTSTAVAAADGGEIPKRAYGGRIRGMGGPRQDNIAGIDRATGVQTSWVSAGEFVVNAKQYQKNRDIVEAINGGLDVQTPSMRAADRAARRALGGLIPKLWLGGGTKPAAGSVSKHSGYSWARWAGDINEPGSADIGHPVVAYKAGVIAGIKSLTTSYGKHIRMNHAGNERTLYAHLSRFNVSPGQRVSEGQKIGEKGNTGNSSGPHLHFELAGGNSSIMEKISNAVSSVLEMIKPQEMFRTAAGPILRLIQAGYSRIPGAGTPFGQLLGRMPQKVVDMLANKLPASFGIETGEASSSPNGSGGLGPRARAARAYVVDRWGITNIGGYANRNIAGTNTLSKHALGKAIDIMNSNVSRGNEIANYFAGPGRGKFGVDNVIWNRRIHNQRGWHGYNGVSPHTDHVHVDFFKNGGEIPGLAAGGLVKGGRGGTLAHIGEGTRDELVTPLPRGWSMGRGGGADDKLERLIALIESGAIGGNHVEITAYNPLPEKTSQSANKGLQRGAALGLV
jgi:murein DD-endopeptidase MepM/ murein hydrolase activator NlpD